MYNFNTLCVITISVKIIEINLNLPHINKIYQIEKLFIEKIYYLKVPQSGIELLKFLIGINFETIYKNMHFFLQLQLK